MPDALLASDETTAAIQELLLTATSAGRETGGVCAHRPATYAERAGAELGSGEIWVLEDFRTTVMGGSSSVSVAVPAIGEIAWHTHPGLRFSMAGFSDGDIKAVQTTQRPLLVVGYTFTAPETLSWLALAAGWEGAAVTVAVQALLRAEAAGKLSTGLSRVGVAVRMLMPGGKLLPVRRIRAPRWRRAIETGTFEVDRVVSAASNSANRWVTTAWSRLRGR